MASPDHILLENGEVLHHVKLPGKHTIAGGDGQMPIIEPARYLTVTSRPAEWAANSGA